jgi:hypothetical protein
VESEGFVEVQRDVGQGVARGQAVKHPVVDPERLQREPRGLQGGEVAAHGSRMDLDLGGQFGQGPAPAAGGQLAQGLPLADELAGRHGSP